MPNAPALLASARGSATVAFQLAPRSELSDVHLKMGDPAGSLVYPGPRRPIGPELALATRLMEVVEKVTRKDFMIDHEGTFWRGRKDGQAVDGYWVRLRRIQSEPPELTSLPTPMARGMVDALLHPSLAKGGLIYVCGSTGAGKTTTASGIVVSRLKKLGGVATTVEEPPEMPLNGWHGSGYCTQTWVEGDDSADWQESMRGVLRSQPAKTPAMLYIGEVRDKATGLAMLRAANNGFLVVATGFGADIKSGLESFCNLVGLESCSSVSACLRAVVYQKLDPRFFAQMVVSPSFTSALAIQIRNGNFTQLDTEIQSQHVHMMHGGDVWNTK